MRGRTNARLGFTTTLLVASVAAAFLPPVRAAEAQQRRDSVVAHRRAVTAQAMFEQIRRRNLPLSYSSPPAPRCGVLIGRFCHWNSDDDTVKTKEPRVITRAREKLLATLASASMASPRDGWITGQRVRYMLEAGNDSGAVGVAASCGGAQWWCEALHGLALHESGAGTSSDSAFLRALSGMPATERCRWTDMTPILNERQRKRFGKVGCGKNEEVARRLWWLADPFLSVPGNDRQAEHYARHTMARILEPARNAYNIQFANDMREMIVRYGWARYWTRGPGSHADPATGAISGHEATPNYHFVPVSALVDSMHVIAFDIDRDPSTERYSPIAADRFIEISPQVALFRRGDSVQVVAAFDVSRHPPFDSAGVFSSLVLASGDRSPSIQSVRVPRGTFSERIDHNPHLLSLEVVSFDKRHAAWMRRGVWLPPRPTDALALSDLLLFEPVEHEVTDLLHALPAVVPGNEVKRGKVAVYWEIYGLARTDSALPLSLTLTPVGRSTLRRIGESIGLAARSSPLSITWRETPGTGSISTRSVVLDLSLVPRGRYQLRVEASPSGVAPAAASRVIEIQ